jgi:nucleoside-diphosphate-sugar epimerase
MRPQDVVADPEEAGAMVSPRRMNNVLVLGAGGQIAHWVIRTLANRGDVTLTLFLRHARKLSGKAPKNAHIVQGDVLDSAQRALPI